MASFVLGEGACAANYLVADNAGLWLEFLHGAGMVGTYALVFGSLFVFSDEHILHYSDSGRRCNMQRLCRQCWKNETVDCGLFRIGLIVLPMLVVMIWAFLVVYRRSYSLKIPASVVRFTNWMLPS